LAEVLCIQSKPVTLERCVALAEGHAEGDVYAALDELVADQILGRDGNSYRFAHGALRDTLLAGLKDTDRRQGHLRAAETLLAADPDNVAVRVEAALHLLDAGEDRRGADMVASIGLSLLSTTYFNAGSEAVVALSRALGVFERQGRSDYELAALLFPMMKLAYYSPHWRLILQHGERALSIGMRITGLSLAQGLKPVIGRKLSLVIGLVIGSIGFQRRAVGYDLQTAIKASCAILPAVTATHATCLDPVAVGRVQRVVEPLKLFGPEHVAALMYEWAPMQRLTVEGREGEAWDLVEENIRKNQSPAVREAMGEASWRAFGGGLLFPRGVFATYGFGQAALRGAEDLERLGIRVWAMAADQIRMLYHAFRGESEEVQRYRERVELFAVQGSTTWQAELFWPALLLNADVLTGDAISARRTSEQLARRSKDVESLKRYADAARAAQWMLRGEIPAAVALYEEILPQFPLRRTVAYETTRAYFAQALNLAGDHARAKEVVTEVISGMLEQDHRIAVHFLEPQRQLGLAEAGLGNHAGAVRILDDLLEKHGAEDNPLLVGLLHKARAELALMMRDVEALEKHVCEMERRFRSTRNPALIAQCERLSENVSRAGLSKALAMDSHEKGLQLADATACTIGELSAAAEPCDYALRLVLDRSKAKAGFLYVYRHESMQLVASSSADDAQPHLEEALAQLAAVPSNAASAHPGVDPDEPQVLTEESRHVDTTGSDVDTTAGDLDAGNTVFVPSAPAPTPWGGYQLILLRSPSGETRGVVGGLILEADPSHASRLGPDFLGGVARVLLDRRAMTSAFSSFVP
jgi:tetratricopeptide (TPR) repeat protein